MGLGIQKVSNLDVCASLIDLSLADLLVDGGDEMDFGAPDSKGAQQYKAAHEVQDWTKWLLLLLKLMRIMVLPLLLLSIYVSTGKRQSGRAAQRRLLVHASEGASSNIEVSST